MLIIILKVFLALWVALIMFLMILGALCFRRERGRYQEPYYDFDVVYGGPEEPVSVKVVEVVEPVSK